MSEPCTKENELGRIQSTVEMVKKEIFNGDNALSKSVPVLSNQVKELTGAVKDLRTAISGFAKFQNETGGRKSLIGSLVPWLAVVIAAISLLVSNIKINKSNEDINWKMQFKVDRKPDSTTRSFQPFINDSIQ